jgi:hypothetical protein
MLLVSSIQIIYFLILFRVVQLNSDAANLKLVMKTAEYRSCFVLDIFTSVLGIKVL